MRRILRYVAMQCLANIHRRPLLWKSDPLLVSASLATTLACNSSVTSILISRYDAINTFRDAPPPWCAAFAGKRFKSLQIVAKVALVY